jgi:tetratricopeptide (TPR) repeat protein
MRRLTTSLSVQLSTERLMRLAGEPDVSLEIYDRWLRGQSMLARFDAESWARAVQLFTEGIRDAPTFSPCYSSLVQMNNVEHFAHPGVIRDLDKAARTLQLAKTAVQLDPVDSRAQLCLGWACIMLNRHTEAEAHMDIACELNENDPWTLISAAMNISFCGNATKAAGLAEQALAQSLAPSTLIGGSSALIWGYCAIIRFLRKDYSSAIDAADRANDVIQTLPAWRAAALFHLGRRREAEAEAARFLNAIRSGWFGTAPPTSEAISRWLLHAHPIRREEDWALLRAGVAGAGLPVEGIQHQRW